MMNREDLLIKLVSGVKCSTGYSKELGKKFIEISGSGGVKFDDGTETDITKHFPPFIVYYKYPIFKQSKNKTFVVKFVDIKKYEIIDKADDYNEDGYLDTCHTNKELWDDVNIETQKENINVYKFAYYNEDGILEELPYFFETVEELQKIVELLGIEFVRLDYTKTLIEKTFYKIAYEDNLTIDVA